MVRLDGERPRALPAEQGVHIPIGMRHRIATRATRRRSWSSSSARWRRGRNWATSTPRLPTVDSAGGAVSARRRRRRSSPGSGSSRPAGWGARSSGTLLTEGRTATRRISFFDPSRFRSQVAAECDFDPARCRAHRPGGRTATTGSCSSRWSRRTRRSPTAGWTSAPATPTTRDRDRGEHSAARSAPRCGWRTSTWRSATPAGTGWSTPATPRRSSTRRWCPAAWPPRWPAGSAPHGPASVVSTGCTSGIDAVGYGAQLIAGRRGRRRASPGPATHRSPRSRSPASTRSGPPRRTTTTRSTPPGLRRHPGRVRHGRGRRGAGPRGVGARPAPRRARSTARSPATPTAATPTT